MTVGDDPSFAEGRRGVAGWLVGAWPILIASLLIRVELARRGGQLYWPDEQNYLLAQPVLELLGRGAPLAAIEQVLRVTHQAYHTGWLLVALLPMAVQLAATPATSGLGTEPLWISAAVLSLASVGCIGLTYAVARRCGAGRGEASLAALLMACSSSLFYFARHLVPYDPAMFLALLATWVGLRERAGPGRTLACGLLAGLAFFTYYGYWLLAGVAVALHLGRVARSRRDLLVRATLSAAALSALPLLFTAWSLAVGMPSFLLGLGGFADTITQGAYSEGWSLSWVYLWSAEGGLLGVWLAGSAFVLWLVRRDGWHPHRRGLAWLGCALSVWLALTLASTGLERFVVYGRLARQMVPFLCLGAAYGLARLPLGRPVRARRIAWVALVLLGAHTAARFAGPMRLSFPREAQRRAIEQVGPVPCASTVAGGEFTCDYLAAAGARSGLRPGHVLLNAHILYPVTGSAPAPEGRVLWRLPHPESYRAYQFEGYTPFERSVLARTDISMRLIETSSLGSE
jgi:hypothetical protein